MKIFFENDFRRFQFPVTVDKPFAVLSKLIEENYGLSSYTVRYEDDDGDICVISSDNEFTEYIHLLNNVIRKKCVKLFLDNNNNKNSKSFTKSQKKENKKEVDEDDDGVIVQPPSPPPSTTTTTTLSAATSSTAKADLKEEKIIKSFDQKEVVHVGISCSSCGVSPLTGVRYKCGICKCYNLCDKCESDPLSSSPSSPLPLPSSSSSSLSSSSSPSLQQQTHDSSHTFLKMKIAENSNIIAKVSHVGVTCDQCGQTPIVGLRYKCQTCLDYDMCESCEKSNKHPSSHSLLIYKQATTQSEVKPSSSTQSIPSQLPQSSPLVNDNGCGECPLANFFRNFSWPCGENPCGDNNNTNNNNNNNNNNSGECPLFGGRRRGRGGRGGRGKCRVVKKIFFLLGIIFVLRSLFCRNGHCCGVTMLLGAFIVFKIFKCLMRKSCFQCPISDQQQLPPQQQQPPPVEEKQEKYSGPFATEIESLRSMGFTQPIEVLVDLFNTASGLHHRHNGNPFNSIQWVANKLLKLNKKGEILE